jgi:cephalosporin hydroxylase
MNEYKKFKKECEEEIKKIGKDTNISKITKEWINCANKSKYSYHFESLGRPIIQYPQDIIAMQELIWKIKPDLIIETGIAHGGSLIMNASMLALLDLSDAIETNKNINPKNSKRKVLGVDIDIRKQNKELIESHFMSSRIEMIEGSSIETKIVEKVHKIAKNYNRILICLDSNHTHDHVLSELKAYAPLTSIGSYCIVFDTIIEDLKNDDFNERPWGSGNNPKTAVWEFLKKNKNFEVDQSIQNKLQITVAPDGYLKRVS